MSDHPLITDAVRARLQSLETAHGTITPAIVVEDAKHDDSPLHALFTWDLGAAAYQHWLERARTIIRSVRVIAGPDERIVLRAPHYVRDPNMPATDQGYVAIPRLFDDVDRARRSVRAEFLRVEGALTRARAIAAVLGLDAEIETLLEQIVRMRDRVEHAA
jgi:hypothetical protein